MDMAKMALIAASPAKARRPSRIEKMAVNHTVFTGVPV